ncbi:MAG: hypothetical protein P4L63_02210 [Candidatus Pacebacteria bacterium]|nr:hypothetical protein [Candidatus Paceibacterota bacterium]
MSDQPPIPNNAEIDAALKEFEASKYHTGQSLQAVSASTTKIPEIPRKNDIDGVSFDTDILTATSAQAAISAYQEKATPGMVKMVMKLSRGAVKTQRQAESILLGFVILMVAFSVFLFIHFNLPNPVPPTSKIDSTFP